VSETVQYRLMTPADAPVICDMVERVFRKFVAPGYTDEGVRAFLEYAQPELLRIRLEDDHFTLVATLDEVIVGMIEVRQYRHVSLLFVDCAYQRRGIARQLMTCALDICRQNTPMLREVTVNSSPYAQPVYGRMGFHPTRPEQVKSGVRYIPMALPVVPAAGEATMSPERSVQARAEIARMVEEACARESNIFGYGIWTHHIQPVVQNGRRLAELLGADAEIVELAAWLHDYASVKDAALYEDHHIHGAALAEAILQRHGYPRATIVRVRHCIEAHRGSAPRARRSLEAECLADADALTHIEQAPALLHLAFVNWGMGIDEGTAWVRAKLTRSWNKLSPPARELARAGYTAVMRTLCGEEPLD
jgi:GNAT superfamily N-acetyltransferase